MQRAEVPPAGEPEERMKLRYTIPEFCQLSGTKRSKAYERIRNGQLAVVKDGHRVFITHEEAVRYANTPLPAAYPRENLVHSFPDAYNRAAQPQAAGSPVSRPRQRRPATDSAA